MADATNGADRAAAMPMTPPALPSSALRPKSVVVVDWTQLDRETTGTDGGAPDPLLVAAQRALDDGDRAVARQHLQVAVAGGGGGVAAATFLLGVLELADGARDDAQHAWQRVLDVANTPWAPRAALNLAVMAAHDGDTARAEQLYRRVINDDRCDRRTRLLAQINLGVLLTQLGHVDEAAGLYQRAIDCDDPEATSLAMLNLARLHKRRGRTADAIAGLRRTIATEHLNHGPAATYELGAALADDNDVAAAVAAYDAAAGTGHPDVRPRALFGAAVLLGETRPAAATARYRDVIDAGHPDVAPMAALNLGAMHANARDTHSARPLWELAVASEHPVAAPTAALNLGALHLAGGDVDAALTAWRHAADTGHTDAAPRACIALGRVLTMMGDIPAARDAFLDAMQSGHPQFGPIAAQALQHLR